MCLLDVGLTSPCKLFRSWGCSILPRLHSKSRLTPEPSCLDSVQGLTEHRLASQCAGCLCSFHINRIRPTQTDTAATTMRQSSSSPAHVEKDGDELRRLFPQYMALPAPPILPSGAANIWSLRPYTVRHRQAVDANIDLIKKQAGVGPEGQVHFVPGDDGKTSADEDIAVMTLFDVVTGKPVIEGHNADFHGSFVCVQGFDPRTGKIDGEYQSHAMKHAPLDQIGHLMGTRGFAPSILRVSFNCLTTLVRIFTSRQPMPSLDGKPISPQFLSALPAMGSFRPHIISVHDVELGFIMETTLQFTVPSSKTNPLKIVPFPLNRDEGILSTATAAPMQMFAFCGHCQAAGFDRLGWAGSKKMLRCRACGVAW